MLFQLKARAVLPQGSSKLVDLTFSPISSHETFENSLETVKSSKYFIVEGDKPQVYELRAKNNGMSDNNLERLIKR